MDYEAPFLESTKTKEASHPIPGLVCFLALLFVPTFVSAIAFRQWRCALFFSVAAAFVLIILCLISLASARFVRRFPLWTKPLTKLVVLLVGIVLLMTPISLFEGIRLRDVSEAVPEEHSIITMLNAVYSAIKTIGLDLTPAEWTANNRIPGSPPDWLLFLHALLLIVYAIACPLAAVFAAFDAVVNGVAGARIRFWSWRKSRSFTKREIYVFHELDEHGATLAHSIIKTRSNELPLIIFANVGDLEASRDETLVEDLLDKATGKAFVLYTSLPAQTIPSKLSRRALKKCTIRYFAISENSTTNIQTAVSLWDAVFEQLWNETWHIDKKRLPKPKDGNYATRCKSIAAAINMQAMSKKAKDSQNPDGLGFDPAAFNQVMTLGERVSIHCLHSHPDDGAILDSLANRSAEHVAESLKTYVTKTEAEELMQGIRELTKCLHSLVEIRLLSQPQLAIYDLFEKHPLHNSLDSINLLSLEKQSNANVGLHEQYLTVLILGCGTYGTEALKAAFWLGRFAGTQLKIVVVDKDNVRQRMDQLLVECPGLMTERTYHENPLGPRKGMWSITSRSSVNTVRFCQMDVFGSDMRFLISGQEVPAMWYELGDNGKPVISQKSVQLLSENDHLYCVVCLNDDDLGLNAALELQRNLSIRKLRAQSRPGTHVPVAGQEKNHVPIALRVRNALTLSPGQLGKNGLQSDLSALGFPLYTFGSLSSVFTYETIAADKAELRAIHTNAAYANAHRKYPSLRKGRMDYYALTEVNRMSNRSSALSIPYKLWMLGLSKDANVQAFQKPVGRGSTPQSDEVFRKALVLPKVLDDGQSEKPDGSEWALNLQNDKEFRSNWPLLAYLADMEHVRWCAFYRSLGWRDTLSLVYNNNEDLAHEGLESEEITSSLGVLNTVRNLIELSKGTQYIDLKLHYYLCDNIKELGLRGADCHDHPFAYDRIITWLSVNIMNGTVCE